MSFADPDHDDIDASPVEPADDAPFNSSVVPGYCDGDYPPWLAQEMHSHLPTPILQQFAGAESSAINGSFYTINPTHRDAIVKALTDAGFTVEERADLKFW